MVGIRTPDHRVRVFISSTMGELAAERAAVKEAIEGLRLVPVLFELGARPHPPRALYRAYLQQSDVFLGIYWERYGWVAPGEDVSGLEDEYRLAVGRMPQLVYIKEPAPNREPRLGDLLRRVQDDDRLAYRRFTSIEELAGLIADDLLLLLSDRFQADEPQPGDRSRPATLPAPLDLTIGRRNEIKEVAGLIRSGHRLVTLTGPGGIGKTRLAIEAARELERDYEGAVVYVPLSDLTDPSQVVATLAHRLGIRFGHSEDDVDEIVAELSSRPTLLLFDNFEHLAAAASEIVSILERCPDAAALGTSRHVLRVRGERDYPVPALDVDASADLFERRSVAVRPSFALTEENREAVDEITRQLDGLPLAIELAAASMRLLSPTTLLDAMTRRMDVLTRGASDAAPRQQTLRATMDWSFDLLDDVERQLFARLAVFSGSWSLAAAEFVCGGSDGPGVLETLAALVEKSLVVPFDDPNGEPRLRMLESVRAYAVEKFDASPDRADVERRHTQWMFELLLNPSRRPRPPHHTSWLERFDQERPNLRATAERALRDADTATVNNLVRASIGYLSLRDAEPEAIRWIEQASAMATDAPPLVRAQLMLVHAVLASALGRYHEARQSFDAAAEFGPMSDDPFDVALASMANAVVVSSEEQGHRALDATVAAASAMARINSDVGQAYMWQTAGTIALSCDPGRADELLSKGLAFADAMDNDGLRAQSRTLLGYSARRAGRHAEAHDHFRVAAEAALRSGQRSSMAYALDGMAALAVDADVPEIAAQSFACSTCARSDLERTGWAAFKPLIDEVADQARSALGREEYDRLNAVGSCFDVQTLLLDALEAVSTK